MAVNAGSLGSFSVRLATLNQIRAGKTALGDNSDLSISASTNVNVTAATTFFTGDIQTKTGTLSSSADAANLTLSTAAGNLILSPYGKVRATTELTTTQGKISSTGTDLTLESGTGDITFAAASNTIKTAGTWVSSRASGGANFTTAGTDNLISSGAGDIKLQPHAGGLVSTDAELKTTHGTITSSVGALITTQADDLTLSPFRDLIATVPFKTTNGSISSTSAAGGLTLSSATGDIALQPAGNLTTNAKFATTDGRIESSVACVLSTTTGNMTLAPAGSIVLDKDTVLTTGNLSSPEGTPLTIKPGNGDVYIDGNLNVQGSITTVNTSSLEVSDKTINLAHAPTASNTFASGSGIIIEGDAWQAALGATDLSLLWNNNSGGSPYWQLSGGDFYITKKIGSAVVTYQFTIDNTTQDLILKKQVDSEAATSVAEFGV
jgi:hypothetical protein